MLTPDGAQVQSCRRTPLAIIDKVVSARLGQTRVEGNAQPAVFHRQIAMYLAKQMTEASLPEIGRQFGNKHHTTVMHSIAKIDDQRRTDKDLHRTLNKLQEQLNS